MTEAEVDRVNLSFRGTGVQFLGWGIVWVLLSLPVVTGAWGMAIFYRWLVRSLSFSDETEASFDGRGAEVFLYYLASLAMVGVQVLIRQLGENGEGAALLLVAIPAIFLIDMAIGLQITRWAISRTKLKDRVELGFKGGYWPYVGYSILVVVSIYTIVGWAWVSVAMLRWYCRNIDVGPGRIIFTGRGPGLLWRGILGALASVLVIPIPWVAVWLMKWVVENTVIEWTAEGSVSSEARPILPRSSEGPSVAG